MRNNDLVMIDKVELVDPSRQHKWDLRFLSLASLVSSWSKDPSTKTGAVIVRPDNSIASVGYNGFPKKMGDNPALYADRNEKYSRVVHCEVNALLLGRDQSYDEYTLYTWPFLSCDRCFVQMVQSGITRFVAPVASKDQLTRWGDAFVRVKNYAAETGVEMIEIPRKELGLEE